MSKHQVQQLYKQKPGGYQTTEFVETGSQSSSDGIRFNFNKFPLTVTNSEQTWVITLHNDPNQHTDKPTWAMKLGTHGKTDEPCAIYDIRSHWNGGFIDVRSEGPHPHYHPCHDGWKVLVQPPKFPQGKPVAVKSVRWVNESQKTVYVDCYFDFENGGNGPWTKYLEFRDDGSGRCNGGSVKGPIGLGGKIFGKTQDNVFRGNGANMECNSAEMHEILLDSSENPIPNS